jgi:methylenetetrahydrofolate dehydrogenase (NAD+)
LAALLANDGARVFSVDIDSTEVSPHTFSCVVWRAYPQEYTKRPSEMGTDAPPRRRYHPHHVVRPCKMTLQECLALSDVVVSAVPSPTYKVKTQWLKDGCVCVNVAADKNFEGDVRDKACRKLIPSRSFH